MHLCSVFNSQLIIIVILSVTKNLVTNWKSYSIFHVYLSGNAPSFLFFSHLISRSSGYSQPTDHLKSHFNPSCL